MINLEVLNVALAAIELLRPIVVRIKKHDRGLARQITDAANSSVLNTGEGALGDAGTRRSRHQSAAGSANEVRVGCWPPLAGVASPRELRHRCSVNTIASWLMLYKLTH